MQPETIRVIQGSSTNSLKQETTNYETPEYRGIATPDYVTGQLVGLDPAPAVLAKIYKNRVVDNTRNALKALPVKVILGKAWRDDTEYYDHGYLQVNRVFASSIPKNANTGLYRQLATRMNSTCHCNKVEEDWPSPCDDGGLNYKTENHTIEFCVDGLFRNSPWKLEQYLREDITEEFYVRANVDRDKLGSPWDNHLLNGDVYRCTGNSTLGYFELGNQFNNGTRGPLVSAPYRTMEAAVEAGFHVLPLEPQVSARSYPNLLAC